ncbi:MAG TPA: F0F1 ATP synthase subunit A [Pyrinomonadaceae bacterium]|jgi:F-type H+-transporting ATPase subunit a|nr:F0F1 ATP synthase subunit A [Pyrinomonadaceae bacterium]
MFFLLQHGEEAAHAAEQTQEHAEHVPLLAQMVNHYFGEWAYSFEMKYTYPKWKWLLAKFGSTPETVFGPYTPENAIPWYTIMFILACIITVALVWILKGRLSEDEPGGGQQTLEAGVLAIRSMLEDIVGPHGLQYFPVVMTFAVLILVSNLMGFFPLFMTPTAATSVTFALGLSSFLYYNYIGIKENGIFGHLKHLAGPIWWIAPLIFFIELISNLIRPFTLGIRLFANMFADEKVLDTISHLVPGVTYWGVPVVLMPLSLFVAFIQTFVFVLLSQLYISEVSHPPHDSHHPHEEDGMETLAPVLT